MSELLQNTGALQSLKAMKEIGHIRVSELLHAKNIETQLGQMFIKNRKGKWLIFLKYKKLR